MKKYTEQIYEEVLEMVERLDLTVGVAHVEGLLTPEQSGAVLLLGPQIGNCKTLLELAQQREVDRPEDILQAEDLYTLITEATIVVNGTINKRRDELRG